MEKPRTNNIVEISTYKAEKFTLIKSELEGLRLDYFKAAIPPVLVWFDNSKNLQEISFLVIPDNEMNPGWTSLPRDQVTAFAHFVAEQGLPCLRDYHLSAATLVEDPPRVAFTLEMSN